VLTPNALTAVTDLRPDRTTRQMCVDQMPIGRIEILRWNGRDPISLARTAHEWNDPTRIDPAPIAREQSGRVWIARMLNVRVSNGRVRSDRTSNAHEPSDRKSSSRALNVRRLV
jgi:hypothetical protein